MERNTWEYIMQSRVLQKVFFALEWHLQLSLKPRIAEGAPWDPIETANCVMLCEMNMVLMPSEDRFYLLLWLDALLRAVRVQETLGHESPCPIQSLATLLAALHEAGMAIALHICYLPRILSCIDRKHCSNNLSHLDNEQVACQRLCAKSIRTLYHWYNSPGACPTATACSVDSLREVFRGSFHLWERTENSKLHRQLRELFRQGRALGKLADRLEGF